MKILVTGTDGFIGNAVASHLVNVGHQVEGWTYIPNKYPDPSQCDRVIHCGAISSTTETDVEKVNAGVITSEPAGNPKASTPIKRAEDPELT